MSVSLCAHSQPHWPMPGWVFTIPLFGRDAAALAEARPRFARRYMAWSAAIVGVILAALTWQTHAGRPDSGVVGIRAPTSRWISSIGAS